MSLSLAVCFAFLRCFAGVVRYLCDMVRRVVGCRPAADPVRKYLGTT